MCHNDLVKPPLNKLPSQSCFLTNKSSPLNKPPQGLFGYSVIQVKSNDSKRFNYWSAQLCQNLMQITFPSSIPYLFTFESKCIRVFLSPCTETNVIACAHVPSTSEKLHVPTIIDVQE